MILTTRAFFSHFFQCRWHQGFMLLVKISVETLSLSVSYLLQISSQEYKQSTLFQKDSNDPLSPSPVTLGSRYLPIIKPFFFSFTDLQFSVKPSLLRST